MSSSSVKSIAQTHMPADDLTQLAAFRTLLRQFQSFSEQASAALGLTSVQYQALLAIGTRADAAPLTVKVLAELLLIKHNSAVGLVDRIEQLGLAVRRRSQSDRRSVVVELTAHGKLAMNRLAVKHRGELHRIAPAMGRHVRQFAKEIAAGPSSPARTFGRR